MADSENDKDIIEKYLQGDEKSLQKLLERHIKRVYNFIYYYIGSRSDADDITQDVFIKVWRNIRKFDRNRSFKTWIFAIAKNTLTDFYRKKKSIPFSAFENDKGSNILLYSLTDPLPLPDKLFEKKDIKKRLIKAIRALPLDYRDVILLRYNQGLTFREISESLLKPLNTVKGIYRRGLVLLRKSLMRDFAPK